MDRIARSLVLVSIAIAAACTGGGATLPPDFLEPCASGADCVEGACVPGSGATGVCSLPCETTEQCPEGWRCAAFGAASACQCSGSACVDVPLEPTNEIDVLLVVDDSNSMSEEQAALAAALPTFFSTLRADGHDVQVGVVSTDMGTAGHAVPTCDGGEHGFARGDDGVLVSRGHPSITGCSATYPRVLDFGAGATALDVACVTTLGTGGCGFEQQLDAALKAVSPASPTSWTIAGYDPPLFVDGTRGHGDGANAGLVRAGSVLAIVVVTDEEDCSATDTDVFDPESPDFAGTDLNLRCFAHPEVRHPIARYVSGVDGRAGLLGLRARHERLVFAAIAGVPAAAIGGDPASILAHPDMIERIDPAAPTRLLPSCDVPGRGIAFPPRRIVQTAQQIAEAGGGTSVQSICQEDLRPAMDEIARAILAAAAGGRSAR